MKLLNFSILIILLIASSSFAAENEKTEKTDFLVFAVTNLQTVNCPQKTGSVFSVIIRNILFHESAFAVMEDSPSAPDNAIITACEKGNCSSSPGQKYSGQILVTGSVIRVEFKSGERKISKYAVEEITGGKYVVTVYVVNTGTGRTDLTYKREVETINNLDEEAFNIGREIKKFYLNRLSAASLPEKK